MVDISIIYGTTEGHTRAICEKIAEWLQADGVCSELIDTTSDAVPAPSGRRFIVAGSLHEGGHQRELANYVRLHRATLVGGSSLFLSVSLSAVRKDEQHRRDVDRCIEAFIDQTGWRPNASHPVAGALLYTQYSWMKRTLMRMISEKEGGDIDTTKDYVYTDWEDLKGVVQDFALLVAV